MSTRNPEPTIPPWRRASEALLAVCLALALVVAMRIALDPPARAPDWSGRFAGVTYSGYRPGQGPAQHRYPSADEVRQDLALLRGMSARIRTYTTTEGPDVPALAAEFGLKVMAGAWLDGTAKDDSELRGLWRQARTHSNIDRLIVGNETLLREDLTVVELTRRMDETRKRTSLPISTAEPWGIWLAHPELAAHADFIAIHLLPYWEWKPVDAAVDHALLGYQKVRQAYPRKPVVIAETGWPSHGEAHGPALATPLNQSLYLRRFADKAAALGLDYFIVEAVDQAWKRDEEGRPGPYWGVMDAQRKLKLQGAGVLWGDKAWPARVAWATAGALLLCLAFCLGLAQVAFRAKLAFCIAVCSLAYLLVGYADTHGLLYAGSWSRSLQALLVAMTAIGVLVLLVQLVEACEVLGRRSWQRSFGALPLSPNEPQPRVSIHLACSNEPPAMVIRTLESLDRLHWDNLEVIVVDNNTADERLWRPVEGWVAAHAGRFRFLQLPRCPGFKAGALNHALANTDARAEVIGVIDADYLVSPDWLRDLVGHFASAGVAVVQAPQAHRDFERNLVQRLANWEFEGFFRIGMHHRNERNAIIQHGTMTLVRAEALRKSGGWAEWTICEDAELGLRLMEQGWETRYVDKPYGRGLAPADFGALRGQRRRWALGAMQILLRHLPALLGPSRLTAGQRFHFLTGWMPWMTEAVRLFGVACCLAWTAGMLASPRHFEPPIPAAMIGFYAVVILRMVLGVVLHRLRVDCDWRNTLGAAVVSVALSHAVAQGVTAGCLGKAARFVVTRKGGNSAPGWARYAAVREEMLLFAALILAACLVVLAYGWQAPEPLAWAGTLALMALPYGLATWFGSVQLPDEFEDGTEGSAAKLAA